MSKMIKIKIFKFTQRSASPLRNTNINAKKNWPLYQLNESFF